MSLSKFYSDWVEKLKSTSEKGNILNKLVEKRKEYKKEKSAAEKTATKKIFSKTAGNSAAMGNIGPNGIVGSVGHSGEPGIIFDLVASPSTGSATWVSNGIVWHDGTTNISYSDYLYENIDRNIEYSEYISEQIDSSISYKEYLTEKLNTNIEYSTYKGSPSLPWALPGNPDISIKAGDVYENNFVKYSIVKIGKDRLLDLYCPVAVHVVETTKTRLDHITNDDGTIYTKIRYPENKRTYFKLEDFQTKIISGDVKLIESNRYNSSWYSY